MSFHENFSHHEGGSIAMYSIEVVKLAFPLFSSDPFCTRAYIFVLDSTFLRVSTSIQNNSGPGPVNRINQHTVARSAIYHHFLYQQQMDHLEFLLLDRSGSLVKEWDRAFKEHVPNEILEKFTMLTCTLEDLEGPHKQFDCIVSPANSYGRLDGGFDKFLSEALCPQDWLAPTRIAQSVLYEQWKGYAPPGTCIMVPLRKTVCEENPHGCSFIALCPTMRVPEHVGWNREVVYNAMWSLLVALDQYNRSIVSDPETSTASDKEHVTIRKVLMTGLGTGTGQISAERCALQMALAVKHFFDSCSNPEKWSSLAWEDAIPYANQSRRTHGL